MLPAHGLLFSINIKGSHRQDNTYHGLCYTSRGALDGTRNSSMGPPRRIDPRTHRTMSKRSYHYGSLLIQSAARVHISTAPSEKCLDWHQGERNVLFNDALNTFYLRLYGVRHMVKDHSDSEK